MQAPRNVLFLCTANSARSIMAEALLNHLGANKFRGFSAGSHPSGRVNPLAIDTLKEAGMAAGDLRSKGWEEFAAPGAPPMDIVITVCDNAAGEVCPVWPGHPVTAHWGIPDPAEASGPEAERREAFRRAAATLRRRIERLVALPLEGLDTASLREALRRIAKD